MNIKERFTNDSLMNIKEFIKSTQKKEKYLKASLNKEGLIENIEEINEIKAFKNIEDVKKTKINKKVLFKDILQKMKKKEIVLKISKTKHLFPTDEDINLASILNRQKDNGFYILSRELDNINVLFDVNEEELVKIDIKAYFEKKGLLSNSIKNFEYRYEQLKMALAIEDSINEDNKIIVEAGTGTGKTLAYLIPAIEWAIKNKKRVIITTNTINLQEQLLYKDIPIAKEVLKEPFTYSIIKGRNNYLCKRRFTNIYKGENFNIENYSEEQKRQLKKILKWGIKTVNGDKAELNFEVDSEIWSLMKSSAELCLGKACAFRESCYYLKNRKDNSNTDILISNHHIFFSDLSIRSQLDFDTEYLILPKYDLVVFDEAHNIENVARSYFSSEISKLSFTRLMGQIQSLKDKNQSKKKEPSALDMLLNSLKASEMIEEPSFTSSLSEIKNLHKISIDVGKKFFDSLILHFSKSKQGSMSVTLNKNEMLFSPFLSEVRDCRDNFSKTFKSYIISLEEFKKNIDSVIDTNQYAGNFSNYVEKIKGFSYIFDEINNFEEENFVYWLEINHKLNNCSIISTPLNIDEMLKESLFSNLNRIIFTSATLSLNKKFEYFKQSIGLINDTIDDIIDGRSDDIREVIIDSPFDYDKQMAAYIPSDMANSDNSFIFNEDVSNFLRDLLIKLKGRAFVLFTSYSSLNHVYYTLVNDLRENDINVLLHGEKTRSQLIKIFKDVKNPVLFGTSSFWEGVDIQGEQLTNVIIVKLPFLVPTDPVVSAISAKLEASGKNSFVDFQIPEAVMKFKQGIGRLIRSKEDYGNIFILDNRVIKKRYGKIFVDSMPTSTVKALTKKEILEQVK